MRQFGVLDEFDVQGRDRVSPADVQSNQSFRAGAARGIWSFEGLNDRYEIAQAAAALQLLEQSGLFDAAYYLAHNIDVAGSIDDALIHYYQHGWRQGRWPNPYFDPTWYVRTHRENSQFDTEPLLHYAQHGERAGLRPVLFFDPVWYRQVNSLADDVGCLKHYLRNRHTGRVSPIPEFDSAWYLANYRDIAQAGMDPMEHYLLQGHKEARNPSPRFDSRFYRLRYLRDTPAENPLLHYLVHRDLPGYYPCMPENETSIPREVRRMTRPGPWFEEIRDLPDAAPRRAQVLAYYLPQYHAVPENDAWWGRGFTEWTNLSRGLPRFAGHYQPRIPRDLGHYRLDGSEILRRQAEMARRAGIGGFVFYFYWFNGRRLLERPLEALLADRAIDLPFCLMWANENWTRRWDGSDDEVLIAHDYRQADEAGLVATLARHFADPRYIRLQGRPLLMIYRPGLIVDARDSIRRWRGMFRDRFGEDPIFVMSQSFGDNDPRPFGMDGAIEFPPHKLVGDADLINADLQYLDHECSAQVYAYDDIAAASIRTPAAEFPLIKTVIPGWDNDARRQGGGLVIHGATPMKYQAWLERLVERAQSQRFFGTALVCVNAWNEWAEGAYLEPDVHFGAAFLNATGRAVVGLAPPATAARLLLVGHDAFAAGAQHLLLHLGRQFKRAFGVQVEFLLLGGGSLQAAYAEVGTVTVPEDDAALQQYLADLHAGGVRRAIVNTCVAASLCERLRQFGIATTLLVHEMPRLLTERHLLDVARRGTAAAQTVVFAAASVRERFAAHVPLDADRTLILPQGNYREVGFSARARAVMRRRLGRDPAIVLAVSIGYGDLRKGFDLFLQVWRAASRRCSRIHMLWVGELDPTIRAHLGGEIEAAEATGRFRVLGWRDDIAELLSAADIFLLPSREDPFPTVVLEALSAGLPVVAFEGSGGIPDLLADDPTSHVVRMADADAMARRVTALADAGARPTAERQRRARAAGARFCFESYAERLLQIAQPDLLRISVVVPSYNYSRFLRARLASIFTQTYPVLEIIVLDDGSTDDSIAVVRDTAAQWGRYVQIVSNSTNSGSITRQWQRAAELARGDFLWIAEADDVAEPGFLAALAERIVGIDDTLLAFCDSRCIDADDQPMRISYRDYYADAAGPGALAQDDVFEAAGFARRFLAERNLILNASAVLWRRAALIEAISRCGDELGTWRLAGDWRVYLEVLHAGVGRVVYSASILNQHRRHDSSVTQRLDRGGHLDEISRIHAVVRRLFGTDPALAARQKRYLQSLGQQSVARLKTRTKRMGSKGSALGGGAGGKAPWPSSSSGGFAPP